MPVLKEEIIPILIVFLQVLATSPSQWWLLFSGQTVVAVSQIFILGIPAQLAATWFPSDQVSSACAIGVFGNQVGLEGTESVFLCSQVGSIGKEVLHVL